ncbi:unnamed protein product [Owenia fusiformis]|uniref:Uncharacterized protein n=1 Tax=Owenia fusiformis TaxID=6347 RepID=A0A8J1UHN2_OWEFU|nr:unnamed protein product [Owenia fusiformis]
MCDAEDIFTCQVCFEEYTPGRQPKLLPCHHSFCIECIQNLTSRGSKVNCPVCRKAHNLCSEDIKNLQTNFYIMSQLPDSSSSSSKKGVSGERMRKQECGIHPGVLLVDFCEECTRSVCATCETLYCRKLNHNFQPIATAHKMTLRNIDKKIASIDNALKDNIDALSHINRTIEKVDASVVMATDDIKQRVDSIVSEIHSKETEILDSVKTRRGIVINDFDARKVELQKLRLALETCKSLCDAVKSLESVDEIMSKWKEAELRVLTILGQSRVQGQVDSYTNPNMDMSDLIEQLEPIESTLKMRPATQIKPKQQQREFNHLETVAMETILETNNIPNSLIPQIESELSSPQPDSRLIFQMLHEMDGYLTYDQFTHLTHLCDVRGLNRNFWREFFGCFVITNWEQDRKNMSLNTMKGLDETAVDIRRKLDENKVKFAESYVEYVSKYREL